MKRIVARGILNEQRRAEREAWHAHRERFPAPDMAVRNAARPLAPYPEHCRHPEKCVGRTYCPRDPICID